MRIKNENILELDGATVSGSLAATTNYKPVYMGHIVNCSFQMTYTGTPAGTFKLQGSNDAGMPSAQSEAQQSSGVVNWTDIPNATTAAISAAGNSMISVSDVCWVWTRLVWTATGAGTTPVLTVARSSVKGV